jgi:membrane protein DedA with SNARE-associated domain
LSNIDSFLHFLSSLPNAIIYVLLAVSAYIENIFPPIPGDTITAFGAFLVSTDRLTFFGVYAATTIGSVAGFMSLFWVGQALGKHFFIIKDYRWFKAEDIIKGEEWLKRYGYILVLFNRFLPGVRSVISIASGISRLSVSKVMFFALLSCAIWNLIWIWLGFELGNNWNTVKANLGYIIKRYNTIIVFVLLCAGIFFVIKKATGNRKNR